MAEIVPVSTDRFDQRLLKQALYLKTHRWVREQYSLKEFVDVLQLIAGQFLYLPTRS